MRSVLWCVVVLCTGCAFRESQPKAVRPEQHVLVGSLGWTVGKGESTALAADDASRNFIALGQNSVFTAEREVVIPAVPPKAIRLVLPLPDGVSPSSVSVTGDLRLNSESGSALSVRIQNVEPVRPSGSTQELLGMNIVGLDEIIPKDQEAKAFLRVRVSQSGRTGADVEFRSVLVTPPSNLELSQRTVAAFESEGTSLPPGVKSLRARSARWDLLQVVTVRNRSQSAVVASVHAILEGRLSTHFHRITVDQQPCSYKASEADWDEVIAPELYALPITEDLPKRFSAILNDSLSENRIDVSLLAGEQALIGIYGSGGSSASFADNGPVRGSPAPLEVVSGCRSRCADPRVDMYSWDPLNRASQYWSGEGFPGASRTCLKLSSIGRIFPESPVPDEDAMNQCALWELSNGTSPWDDHRFCHSPEPGNQWHYPTHEMWRVQKFTTTINVGLQSFPVVLGINPESTQVKLRYADVPEGMNAEARTVPALQERSVQVQ